MKLFWKFFNTYRYHQSFKACQVHASEYSSYPILLCYGNVLHYRIQNVLLSTRGIVLKAYLRGTVNISSIYISTASSKKIFFLWFTNRNVTRTFSLRSKCFQSSYSTRVRAGAKKKLEGGGGGEKRKRLPASPTILENAPRYFTVRFICKLTARQDR